MGAGSVGGYFGARLIQSGHEVVFLVREGRKRALESDGLVIRSYLGDADLKVRAETDVARVGNCDVFILTIRNFHLNDDVLSNLRHFSQGNTRFISLLNGVEHIERLREIVPSSRIVGGSAFIDSRLGEKGEIVHRSQDPTIRLGIIEGSSGEKPSDIISDFQEAGVKVDYADDLLAALWRKFTFVLLGTFTGVANSGIGAIVENKWLNSSLDTLANEIRSVAVSESVNLTPQSVQEMLAEIRAMRKEWKSLLTEDVETGRQNELESLWGYIVRKADKNGIEVPLSRLSYGMFKLKSRASGGA